MEILSQLWSILGLLAVIQNMLPPQLRTWLRSLYESVQDSFITPYSYYEIPEFHGHRGVDINDLYRHVSLYISSINPAATCCRVTLSRSRSSTTISCSAAPNHTVHDTFAGYRLSWTHNVKTVPESPDDDHEKRSFTLTLSKHHRLTLLPPYLDHLTARALEFESLSRYLRLFTNSGHRSYVSGWSSVPFRHPSTFETLALEPELKRQLVDDLKSFGEGKEFYHKIGRAWKRGYLLYGHPGTGKSSLIAAMANFLRYDVYDLELSKVADNSELRSLLIQTTNRSIIVIEDIDCSIDLTGDRLKRPKKACRNQENEVGQMTLSGLQNFTDGLWSCCGEERVIVFTTNHRDSVDPGLLRCGRMDMHVSLGACGIPAFRALVKNYLDVESHALFDVVDGCIRSGGALMPAQVAEIFLRNRRDVDSAMEAVISAMEEKILGSGVDVDGGVMESEELMKTPESMEDAGFSESPEDSREGKKRGDSRRFKLLVG